MTRHSLYSSPTYAQIKRQTSARNREQALELTRAFEAEREALRTLLSRSLGRKISPNWMGLPKKPDQSIKQFLKKIPKAPYLVGMPKRPEIGWLSKLLGRTDQIEQKYLESCSRVTVDNNRLQDQHLKEIALWEAEKAQHDEVQRLERESEASRILEVNDQIKRLRLAWKNGEAEAVVQYVAAVTLAADHPSPLSPKMEFQYDRSTKLLVIDYSLPNPEEMPTTKAVRYNATTGQVSTTQISKTEARDLYDTLCYQACLRTINDVFRGDNLGNIDSIAFNGNVNSANTATGHASTAIILSLLVDRPSFTALKLETVDPKTCFKSLKGVSASSLSGLASVVPVIWFDKNDRRFIQAHDVELTDDGSVNLAAMGWEDFEHLVRQIFEKEFSARGGEVRVTQSTADGGVDAVAFDPDPITGGKIVIQAKRYTRPVGVSAVRDLFGTAQSEGAAKGILVTTSDFGPDAYKFAQGKPITLLNGGHLLHLLEKHGMRARIDIGEARKEMGLTK